LLNILLFRQRLNINKFNLDKNANNNTTNQIETIDNVNNLTKKFSIPYRNKHFTALLALVLFYLSFLVGISVFKNKEAVTIVPDIKPGTFGLRAWRCTVKIKDLKVSYLDTSNVWREIPNSIICDSNNWLRPVWNREMKGRNSPYDYLADFDSIQYGIIKLAKCAAIFYPKDSVHIKYFNDLRVTAKVSFWEPDSSKNFPSFQFVLHVDTTYVFTDIEKRTLSDYCLQYCLPIKGSPHPWIPALDWEPVSLYRSPIKDLLKYGKIYQSIEISPNEKGTSWYNISAIWNDDQLLFLSHDYGSSKLFETKVNKHKNQ